MSTSLKKPVKKSAKTGKKKLADARDRTPAADKVKGVVGHLDHPRRVTMLALGGLTKLLGMRNTVLLAAGGAAGYLAGRIAHGSRRAKKR